MESEWAALTGQDAGKRMKGKLHRTRVFSEVYMVFPGLNTHPSTVDATSVHTYLHASISVGASLFGFDAPCIGVVGLPCLGLKCLNSQPMADGWQSPSASDWVLVNQDV